mmetsp:Transcript_45322/g.33098  ORF Transcript_45322/g.33098 Transcript_45322/m.33098 type:complete len:95 (+) Transcript_45322:467-751(+)
MFQDIAFGVCSLTFDANKLSIQIETKIGVKEQLNQKIKELAKTVEMLERIASSYIYIFDPSYSEKLEKIKSEFRVIIKPSLLLPTSENNKSKII